MMRVATPFFFAAVSAFMICGPPISQIGMSTLRTDDGVVNDLSVILRFRPQRHGANGAPVFDTHERISSTVEKLSFGMCLLLCLSLVRFPVLVDVAEFQLVLLRNTRELARVQTHRNNLIASR